MSSRVVLEGVDRYRVMEPMFESVRVVLSYRGEKYSPAYIQGISGQAFRIAGPCPCAPTCDNAMGTQELIPLLGYKAEWVALFEKDSKERYPQTLTRLRDDIRASRPVIVWNAFTTAEFDVVCGFDEEKKELIGRGSYKGLDGYATASQDRPLESDVAPAIGIIFVGDKVGTFDAPASELAALKEAVAHARRISTQGALPAGLDCYDRWIATYANRGSLVKAKTREGKALGWVASQTPDDFYPLEILPGTRKAAADFMRELAPKYAAARPYLEMAAVDFDLESAALDAVRKSLGDRKQEPSDAQCVQAAGYLGQARAMYALAIEEISKAVPLIEKQRKDEAAKPTK